MVYIIASSNISATGYESPVAAAKHISLYSGGIHNIHNSMTLL